ncbi:beta propeller repeat protein [Streptomyces cadmiisoli]|uniref:hypothetical protein n=1 Tax=Streptomyces cadmiisoli TaxID=2184053 RepID=UPI003668CC44
MGQYRRRPQPRACIEALDLASHPASSATLWAATGTALERSSDGGRTFRPVSSAPALVVVEEPQQGLLVGLAADGRVLTGRRGGEPWTRVGRLPGKGRAAVLTAVTQQWLLAADSTDAAVITAPCARPDAICAVCVAGAK